MPAGSTPAGAAKVREDQPAFPPDALLLPELSNLLEAAQKQQLVAL